MNISNLFLDLLSKTLRLFFRSRTINHILSLTNNEKKEFLTKIISENKKYHDSDRHEFLNNNSYKFIQEFNQLPCTLDTRKKRADLLEKNGFRDKQILLMGDDDLLSVELAARNFKYVTVLDCDSNLIDKLKILTNESKFPISFLHIDLNHILPNYLSNLFDVVCFDPPQNSKDLNIFIESALKTIKLSNSCFYMMINTAAIGEKNLAYIMQIIKLRGFKETNKIEFFNCYPLNRGQSLLLSFISRFLRIDSNERKYIQCKFYFTDCYEFHSTHVSNSLSTDKESKFLEENSNAILQLNENPSHLYNILHSQFKYYK